MASYDENKLTRLSALKQLATKVKSESDTFAQKVEDTYAKKEDITTVYKPAGSTNFAGLEGKNIEANLGNVYNVTDQFTTDENFVEGADKAYPANTNVVVVYVEETYKFDALAGFVDLSNYLTKEEAYKHPEGDGNLHVPATVDDSNENKVLTAGNAAGLISWGHKLEQDVTAESKLTDTTYDDFTGATESEGVHGLVPAPLAENKEQFLKGDGTWSTPVGTTYDNFKGASDAEGESGLVPAPTVDNKDQFLKGDGSWATPYEDATKETHGLMSTADKKKLDGIEIAEEQEITEMLNEVFPAE